MASSSIMSRPLWLTALSFLLLAVAPTPSLAPTDEQLEQLHQLRRIVLDGLELKRRQAADAEAEALELPSLRRSGSSRGASLDDVFAGARAFATGMAAEAAAAAATTAPAAAATTNGTAVAPSPIVAWFQNLFHHMLAILPLAAWIAILAAFIVLLVGLIILIVCCCLKRRERQKGARVRGKGHSYPLLYHELDIVGKEQPPYGIINFALEYDVPSCTLIVSVAGCIGLPKDLKELDPYVVIRVSPDKGKKHHHHHHHHQKTGEPDRSKVVKNSVDPSFNYTKRVKIRDKRELRRKLITFEVYDWDIGSRHRMIARRVLNLSKLGESLDDILGRKVEFVRNLQAGVNQEATGPGDICLALCYSIQEKHLWVHIIECKGVFLQKSEDRPDLETMPNTYVKLTLTMTGSAKRINKATNTIKESRNPYFNEQFVFKMEPIQMQVASLRVVLMHRTDTLRIKRTLGVLTLSLTAEKDSLALLHWRETVLNHGRPMARWHSLITLEEEQRQAELKASAELKKQLELAEEQQAVTAAAAAAEATGGTGGVGASSAHAAH